MNEIMPMAGLLRPFCVLAFSLAIAGCKTAPAVSASPAPVDAPTAEVPLVSGEPSMHVRTFDAGGIARSMRVYVPAANDGNRSLVVLFHGLGDNAESFGEGLNAAKLAETLKVIVAVPDGTPNSEGGARSWNAGACCAFGDEARDDASLLPAIKANIAELTPYDETIVDVAGFSNGGFFVEYLACTHPEWIRGGLSVAGGMPMPGETCTPSKPVRLVRIHGKADERVPFDGGEWRGHQLPSYHQSFVDWRSRIGCSNAPVPAYYGHAACRTQLACPNGSLATCEVESLGHSWPTVRATGLDVFKLAWQVWTSEEPVLEGTHSGR